MIFLKIIDENKLLHKASTIIIKKINTKSIKKDGEIPIRDSGPNIKN